MRSHLITIPSSSSSDHLHKKKLPPLVNEKVKNHSNNTNKSLLKPSEEDTLLQEKLCKECGKSFQSWKALFGHMKCHSVNAKIGSSTVDEDSSNSSNGHHKHQMIMDSQSDNEAANPLCKRKRSDRMKRYTATTTNSSSLTNANPSSSSMIIDDELEQEEVALSLIILSRDKGDWDIGLNSVLDSSDHDHSSQPLEARKIESFKFKKQLELKNLPDIPRNGVVNTRKLQVSADNKFDEECEVNSPKNLIKRSALCGQFESKKSKSRKRKSIDARASELSLSSAYYAPSDSELCHDFERKSKFSCSICKKAFSSYQALGGHRASHKKFKGCCAPISENILENNNNNNNNTNQSAANVINTNLISVSEAQFGLRKNIKEHECPICFKVFSSGQALGGHKRSHLIGDLSKNETPIVSRKPIKKTRDFLDLNLPAPDEEECNDDFKAWWVGTSHKAEPLLGLLSG